MNFFFSNPLFRKSELKENSLGVRNAAQSKLLDELGIPAEDVPVDQFTPLGRMLYKAPSDGKWENMNLFPWFCNTMESRRLGKGPSRKSPAQNWAMGPSTEPLMGREGTTTCYRALEELPKPDQDAFPSHEPLDGPW
ncbi:hypothetical protein KY285_023701 [Solanum tuberosum]|nr:hypothetical protein KY289_024029 [Solanum tuberosum]KAH0675900.1 hypothetical protein KY285_023701 [Solanum tuberosum]